MSTWISKARAASLVLIVAACVPAGGPRVVNFGSATLPGFAVAAPHGFCAAEDSRSRIGANDFVAFTRCPGATGSPVLLTATVGIPGSGSVAPDPAGLAAFFTSQAGRRMLSRAGRADSVTVHEVIATDGATLLHLTDRARAPGTALGGEGWRAVAAIDGRLVTLTVSGTVAAPLAAPVGRRLIDGFLRATRAANQGS
ncbi:MAG: cation transport ATPase [Paracoccaceae bacterium]|nr:MAG: cation transport ATPase [Paracoccaceae bacterium]